jgi:molybdopterin-containing oxidoreductase family membrane subunit
VAGIARLFEVKVLEPVTRIAELLTITALISGAIAVVADLGRPFVGLDNLPKLANPTSPFFGTFTLVVAGYLFSSLVYFFVSGRADAAALARDRDRPLALIYRIWASGYSDTPDERRRHKRVSFVLSLTILPLLVVAHSTLGFIFGIQVGRPGWYSALQAPAFVVMAGVSGTGCLILLILLCRRLFAVDVPNGAIRWLGNFMWLLALVYLYFMVVDELEASYAAPTADREVAHAIVRGAYRELFWTVVICLFLTFLIPFLLYLRGKTSPGWVGVAAVLGNVAALLKRILIVVPSQTHGALLPIEPESRVYMPGPLEIGAAIGLVGLVLLMVLLFGRIFPLVPGSHDIDGRPPRDLPRTIATSAWALFATALIAVGLADSFRLLRPTEIDPSIPFAPVIFAIGVMVLFSSAIVYEVFPRGKG